MARITISEKIIDYVYPRVRVGMIVKFNNPDTEKVEKGIVADYMNGEYEIITLTDDFVPTTDVRWMHNSEDLSILDEDAHLGFWILNYYKFKVEPDAKRGRFAD